MTPVSGGGAPGVKKVAGRTLATTFGQCLPAATAYGKCCVALGKDVNKGACAKEFEALRKCFAQARKKP